MRIASMLHLGGQSPSHNMDIEFRNLHKGVTLHLRPFLDVHYMRADCDQDTNAFCEYNGYELISSHNPGDKNDERRSRDSEN